MTHPSGLTDDERQAYWDAAMHIGPHKYASQRGRFPQLRGVLKRIQQEHPADQHGPWCAGCQSLAVNGECVNPCECHAGSKWERDTNLRMGV